MGFLKPSDNSYDPDLDLQEEGEYLATCCKVRENLPSKYGEHKQSIAIEFVIDDPEAPHVEGMHCSIMCPQSLWRTANGSKQSILCGYLIQAGFKDPWNGCDPSKMIGKRYRITCIRYEGRVFVRGLEPMQSEDKPSINPAFNAKPLAPAPKTKGKPSKEDDFPI